MGPARLPPTLARPGQPPRPAGPPPAPSTPAGKVALRSDDPSRGPEGAKITIAEFSDFQCPFCVRVGPTLQQVELAYPGAVRIVFKHLPLGMHPNARPAALAAEAAREQGKFWPMHDELFRSQRALSPELYTSTAEKLGLDLERFKASMASGGAAEQRVAEDEKQAGQLGVNGTPALFINCRLVAGAYPFESIKPILDEEVKKADALIAQGKTGTALAEALCEANVQKYPSSAARAAAAEAPAPVIPGGRDAVAVRADDPVQGKAEAPVTVVEFSDFQCPFCARATPAVKELAAAHPEKVRVVWKHLPLSFHQNAVPAALAAEAARAQGGPEKFWAMHDKLFAGQASLSQSLYEASARELGLDLDRFKRDMADPKLKARVEEDAQLAQKLGVSGTPTFIVNGERVVGSGGLRAAVERLLQK